MTDKDAPRPRTTAARLAVRRGEFVQWRRRVLSETWLWVAAFLVIGTILVLPGRQRSYPALSPGDVAPSDIVVDREVTLPDPESTEQKRRRASLEVLPVYVLDDDVAAISTAQLDRIFAEGRRDASGSAAALAQRLTAVVGHAVEPAEAEALRAARFGAEVQSALAETVTKLYRQGIVGDRIELLQGADRGITLRGGGRAGERVELDVYRFLDGGAGLVEAVEQRLAAEPGVARAWRLPLASLLGRGLVPNVLLDRAETLARRLKVAASVEEVVVRLPRGRVLVRRGDEVTPQTARLLLALATHDTTSASMLPLLGTVLLLALLVLTWYFFLQRETTSSEELHGRFGGAVILTLLMLALERASAFLAGAVAASVMRDPFGHLDVYLPALPHDILMSTFRRCPMPPARCSPASCSACRWRCFSP